MTGWTEKGLIYAWRALSAQESGEHWRFVRLTEMGSISVEAGCQFPHGREALIFSFPGPLPVNPAQLPEGQGFDVVRIDDKTNFAGRTAIALIRRQEGAQEIFAIMVVDVLRTLEAATSLAVREMMDSFLDRVKEWQDFMTRKRRPLSLEAQIGLFGELLMLKKLTVSTLGPDALNCWQGPVRANQDFHINGGAIEVKSTIRMGSFIARINSIEQLDDDRAPLFLCAFRFQESVDGTSLAQLVSKLREKFMQAGVHRGFEALLMVMGYDDDHEKHYGRTIKLQNAKVFSVEGDMPFIRRSALPAAIRSVSYVLDLDAIGVQTLGLDEMLTAFGAN